MRLLLSSIVATLVVVSFAGCTGGSKGAGDPVANFTVTPKGDGITFLFDATNSTDPDGQELTVAWSFGDEGVQTGTLSEYGLIEYEYAVTNTVFTVSLVVRDPDGHASAHTDTVTLGNGVNQAPQIQLRNATRWVQPGSGVVLDASKSSDADQDFFSYEWMLGPMPETNASLESGSLAMGGVFEHTFDANAVWDLQCAVHPWMKSRVVVGEGDPNATASAVVHIANFTYEPKTTVVSPGGKVTWINDDPVNHTASTETFSPGKIVFTGPVFSQRLEEGDYQARLILNDGKGGKSSQTWGLKASTDAPASPELRELFNETVDHVDGTPSILDQTLEYVSAWPASLVATVAWSDPPGQGGVNLTMLKDGAVVSNCAVEGTTCTLAAPIEVGTYSFHIVGEGVLVQSPVSLVTSAINYSKPDFGDS